MKRRWPLIGATSELKRFLGIPATLLFLLLFFWHARLWYLLIVSLRSPGLADGNVSCSCVFIGWREEGGGMGKEAGYPL